MIAVVKKSEPAGYGVVLTCLKYSDIFNIHEKWVCRGVCRETAEARADEINKENKLS